MLITVDFVMGNFPCPEYTRERVASLLGDGKTLLECLRSDAVPAKDRIWLATRKGACSERVQRLFACWCADQVLPLFERAYPDDDRPRIAIQAATANAMGEATDDEWHAASDDAWDASARAARDDKLASYASRDEHVEAMAAWAATWAAWDAATTAAMAAAVMDDPDDARPAQVEAFIELLETHGE